MIRQLTDLFEMSDYHNLYSEFRNKQSEYAIEDIFDGDLYKMNDEPNTISINFSVDGVPIFKSSITSIHPLLCVVNEIAPSKRRSNIMLVSLWYRSSKPDINQYLKPFVIEAQKLHTSGFSYTYRGTTYNKKCRVLVGISDSAFRHELRKSTSFRGYYGCGLCKNPGIEVEKGRGHVHVYPVSNNNGFGEGRRTHAETLQHAETMEKGIKTRSILCDIPEFDIINNLDVDWMHCVSLGVCRQFCKMWFDSTYSKEDFYLGASINEVNALLLSFKPSLEISRPPRKMKD